MSSVIFYSCSRGPPPLAYTLRATAFGLAVSPRSTGSRPPCHCLSRCPRLLLGLFSYSGLAWLLGLGLRLGLRGDRFANHHIVARRARDRPTHDQQIVLSIHLHHPQVACRHTVATHPAGPAHALHDAG